MLGRKLKEQRFKRGITQAEFARDLGVSQQAVGGWEVNRSEPSFDTLKRIANYFGVTTDYLLDKEKQNVINNEENALLDGYRQLNADGQKLILTMMNSLRLTHAHT